MSIKLKIGVIGHKREYDAWIRDLEFADAAMFRFICNPDSIRGIKFSSIVRLRGWYLLEDAHKLYDFALTHVQPKGDSQ